MKKVVTPNDNEFTSDKKEASVQNFINDAKARQEQNSFLREIKQMRRMKELVVTFLDSKNIKTAHDVRLNASFEDLNDLAVDLFEVLNED